MLISTNDQRLGDMAGGTIVIRERAAAQMSVPVVFYPPPGWEPFVESLDVSAMTSAEYETVRSFLIRAHEMAPLPRANLAARLAGPLVARWHQPVPEGAGPELWLACAASAYQRRHGAPASPYGSGPWGPPHPGALLGGAWGPPQQQPQPRWPPPQQQPPPPTQPPPRPRPRPNAVPASAGFSARGAPIAPPASPPDGRDVPPAPGPAPANGGFAAPD
jgi:hypothetical protein